MIYSFLSWALAYLCLNIIIETICFIYGITQKKQNVIIQQHLITTICVNIFHQSGTGWLTKNTVCTPCNRSIYLTYFDGQLIYAVLWLVFTCSPYPWSSMEITICATFIFHDSSGRFVIRWPLFLAASSWSWYQSCFIHCQQGESYQHELEGTKIILW